MVTMTCARTGVEFEANSKRQKNHPTVSALLTEANKAGAYRAAEEAIAEARASGAIDIDTFIAAIREAIAATVENRPRRRTWGDRIRQAKQRKRQNAALRAAGYRWSKELVPNQSPLMDDWGEEWVPRDPQGNPVSLAAALAAIGWQN